MCVSLYWEEVQHPHLSSQADSQPQVDQQRCKCGGTPAISFRWQGGGGGRTWRSFACLVEVGQSLVLHELVVQLLELVERVLVVLTCALGKDVHPEVGLGNFLLVLLLVGRGQRVSLSLQFLLKHTKSQKWQPLQNIQIQIRTLSLGHSKS